MTDDIVTRLRDRAEERQEALDEYWRGHKFDYDFPMLESQAADEIERWRDLAIHAWVHMGIDATCSDDDCEQCQTIKKAWENK